MVSVVSDSSAGSPSVCPMSQTLPLRPHLRLHVYLLLLILTTGTCLGGRTLCSPNHLQQLPNPPPWLHISACWCLHGDQSPSRLCVPQPFPHLLTVARKALPFTMSSLRDTVLLLFLAHNCAVSHLCLATVQNSPCKCPFPFQHPNRSSSETQPSIASSPPPDIFFVTLHSSTSVVRHPMPCTFPQD